MLQFLKRKRATEKRQISAINDSSWDVLTRNYVGTSAVESIPSVAHALSLIADSIASLPPCLRRVTADGKKEPVTQHQAMMYLRRPNSWMSWSAIVSYVIRQTLLQGNAFLVIKGDQLIPVPRSNVSVRDYDTRLYYDVSYQYPRWDAETLSQDQVIHFKLGSTNGSGTVGVSPLSKSPVIVQLAQQQLAMALKATEVGVYPSAVIKIDDTNMTADEAKQVQQQVQTSYSASNAFQTPLITGAKTDFTSIPAQSVKEAMLHEAIDQSIQYIASIFNIPENQLNRGKFSTLSNYKESSRILLRYTLHPHIVRFQQTFSDALLEPDIRLILDQSEFVESKSERYANLAVLVKHGIINAEQAKEIEGIS